MSAGKVGNRHPWMRRTIRGMALAIGSVTLLGSLGAGVASAATLSATSHAAAVRPLAPPIPGLCNAAHDGWVWIDLDTGRRWQCIRSLFGPYEWVEISSVPVGSCPGALAASKAAIEPKAVVCG